MKAKLRAAIHQAWEYANRGKAPYILSVALVVIGFVLVYLSPRSIPAFLVFAAAAALPYFLDMKRA
ncbi:MAG: hypothetical protein JXM71_04810, partial [Spirochaetales bacterium]|nr:hypothetical protein [Spirochaetales bacterium]